VVIGTDDGRCDQPAGPHHADCAVAWPASCRLRVPGQMAMAQRATLILG